ncbi:hypothetical protein H1C71_040492, partial [Ictidomys tridecemlineatus]
IRKGISRVAASSFKTRIVGRERLPGAGAAVTSGPPGSGRGTSPPSFARVSWCSRQDSIGRVHKEREGQRLHRSSPFEEVFNKVIEYQEEDEEKPSNCASKVWIKDRNSTKVTKGEIIADGQGNTFWISTSKGDLRLTKDKDVCTR